MALQPTVSNHQAFGDRLFGRGEQTLVEPDGVRAGHLVQAVGNFRRVESAAQHLRSQHAHAATDRAGGKDFLDHFVVVIDRDIKVLAIERNPPGRATQLARTLEKQLTSMT